MAEEYSISQLTEDTTADDSDLIEVSKDNGDGTYTSRKQTRETLLEGTATQSELEAHQSDTTNPHNVTKGQVGLGNVDNTSDASKPISTAVQSALNAKANATHTHDDRYYTESETDALLDAKADTTDLHSHANKSVLDATTASFTTADETKLDEITDQATKNETDAHLKNRANHTGTQTASTISDFNTATDARITAQKGQNNGLASLDSSGKVPSSQLPSYVDDVVEATSFGTLPGSGTAGIIYVTIDTNKTYRWSGSAYVEISPSPGSTDAVPEGSTNKYFTDSRVSANSDVAANTASRHTHSNKSVLDATTASFTTADETKLEGIATGATANSTDATLLNRSNHTGTQAISTVAGLQSALDGKADDGHAHVVSDVTGLQTALDNKADLDDIPTLPATIVQSVVAGTNVTIDASDPENPVISASGGGGGGGAVDSVNGHTGVVVLDADDIDDTSTSHKFATATQLANADSAVQPGDLATVATTGNYTDLSNLPGIPESLTDLDTSVTGAQLNDLKTKVDGIEEGAQVNDVSAADIADFETSTELDARDTANRSRANHTGEQPVSSITGLQDQLYALDQDIAGKSPLYHQHQNSDDIKINQGGTLTEVVDVFLESLDTKANNSDVVHTTGDETVAGVKTFTSSPVVPTPTTDMQVATKKYVDDGLSTKANSSHTHAQSDITNLTTDLAGKQDTLVSGTNIKTVNGASILGSGDLTVSGGGGSSGGGELPYYTISTAFESSAILNDRWTGENSGGGTDSVGKNGLFMQTATGVGTWRRQSLKGFPSTLDAAAGSVAINWWAGDLFPSGPNHHIYLGIGRLTTGTNNIAFTENHLGFKFKTTTNFVSMVAYATNANGTTETATSFTPDGSGFYSAQKRGTTNIKYFSGETLVATHTTNLPLRTSGSELSYPISISIHNGNTSGGCSVQIGAVSYHKKAGDL